MGEKNGEREKEACESDIRKPRKRRGPGKNNAGVYNLGDRNCEFWPLKWVLICGRN